MNSFYHVNQYYIQKLHSGVRGLNLSDRSENYHSNFKTETRERLKKHFSSLETQFQKKEFYGEALDIFKEFEFEFLFLSVYFDEDSEYLLKELHGKFKNNVPPYYVDRFSLLNLVNKDFKDGNRIGTFLKSLYDEVIDIESLKTESITGNNNAEINQLAKWLLKHLREDENSITTLKIFIHYNKYWSINFCNPYNYVKGIVLLDKIKNSIDQIPLHELEVNLNQIIKEITTTLNSLLPNITPAPFCDTADLAKRRNPNVLQGYLKKVEQFALVLERISYGFYDFNKSNLIELFENYNNLNSDLKNLCQIKIAERFKAGIVPNKLELQHFRDLRSSLDVRQDSPDDEFLDIIIRSNYIF